MSVVANHELFKLQWWPVSSKREAVREREREREKERARKGKKGEKPLTKLALQRRWRVGSADSRVGERKSEGNITIVRTQAMSHSRTIERPPMLPGGHGNTKRMQEARGDKEHVARG